jgi:hypothetical protein
MSHPRLNHVVTVCAFLFLALISVAHATAQPGSASSPCGADGPDWYRTYAVQTRGDGRIYAAASVSLPDSAWARGAAERRAWADLISTVVTGMQAVTSSYFQQWPATGGSTTATEIADSTYFKVRYAMPRVIRTWNSTNCPETYGQGATQYRAYTVVGADLSPLIHSMWTTLQPHVRPATAPGGAPNAASFEQAVLDRLGITRGAPGAPGAPPESPVAARSTGPTWYKTYGQDLKGNGRLYRGGSSTSSEVGEACQTAVNRARESLAASLRQSLQSEAYTYLERVNRGADKALADSSIASAGRALRKEATIWNSADEPEVDKAGTTRHRVYVVAGADPLLAIRSAWSVIGAGDKTGAADFEAKVLAQLDVSGTASDVGVVADGAAEAPCRIEKEKEKEKETKPEIRVVETPKVDPSQPVQYNERFSPGRRYDFLTFGIKGTKEKATPFGDLVGWEWGRFGLRFGHVEYAPQMPSRMIISVAGLSLRQPIHVGSSYIFDIYALGLGPGRTFSNDIGSGDGMLAKDDINFADAGLRYLRGGLCFSAGYRWVFADVKWSDTALDADKAIYDLTIPEGAFASLSVGGHHVNNVVRYDPVSDASGADGYRLGQSGRPFRIAVVGAAGMSTSDYTETTENLLTGEKIYNITSEAALQLSVGFAKSLRLAAEAGYARRQEGVFDFTSRDYHATLQLGGGSWPGHGAYGYFLGGGDIINLLSAEWDPSISGYPGPKEDVLAYMTPRLYGWHAGVGFVAGSKWLFFTEVRYSAMVTYLVESDGIPLKGWSIRMGLGI